MGWVVANDNAPYKDLGGCCIWFRDRSLHWGCIHWSCETINVFRITNSLSEGHFQFYSNKVHNLWAKSEEIWEGTFSLIASFLILVIGIAFLRLEQSIVQWKIKLAHAFQKTTGADQVKGAKTSRYALFLLPFITVLREGLEAVVFASGVS